MTIHVGFTGTQGHVTRRQIEALEREFLSRDYAQEGWYFHHGDCIGADEQAHSIAKAFGARIYLHPPKNSSKRAFVDCDPSKDVVLKPKHYLERNKDIVSQTSALIAMPNGPEVVRSGTWSTVRYARRLKRPIFIIYPDGEVASE